MARLARVALLGVLLLAPAFAQEETGGAAKEERQENNLLVWKWLNFGLLAVGLGYVIVKKAPAFFEARSADIQKAIKDATGLKIEAEFRASEMDRRMASLAAEIDKLRHEAKAEMDREAQRIEAETRDTIDRIREHTTREIEALHRQAVLSVREHAVSLAADRAIRHLRENPEELNQDELIHAFAGDVMKGAR